MTAPLLLQLGSPPGGLVLVLSAGSVFSATVNWTNADGTPYAWPSGTAITLSISGPSTGSGSPFAASWNAAVSGSTVTFSATVEQVSAVPYNSHAQLYADTSGDGTAPVLLLSGDVQIYA